VSALIAWLDELDGALVAEAAEDETQQRLDALIDQGVTLLAAQVPVTTAGIDSQVIDRVQRRLRAIADEVAGELDAVRRARHELTRAGRAHAGYRAASAP
jgi:hypothetical protein